MTQLLNLTGKALEKELDRIARENPSNYKPWTAKEEEILRGLRRRGVPLKKCAEVLGRSYASIKCHYQS